MRGERREQESITAPLVLKPFFQKTAIAYYPCSTKKDVFFERNTLATLFFPSKLFNITGCRECVRYHKLRYITTTILSYATGSTSSTQIENPRRTGIPILIAQLTTRWRYQCYSAGSTLIPGSCFVTLALFAQLR